VKIGEARGVKIGEAQANKNVILNMHRDGYEIEKIVKIVGMPLEDVNDIIKQLS
jgi:hypothetical protein